VRHNVSVSTVLVTAWDLTAWKIIWASSLLVEWFCGAVWLDGIKLAEAWRFDQFPSQAFISKWQDGDNLFKSYCYFALELNSTPSTLQKVIQKPWPGRRLWLCRISSQAKAASGRDFGLAWLGLIGPGLAWPTAWSRAMHITTHHSVKHQFLGLLHHKLLQ